MNLPNKLTILRMIMVPFFVVAMMWSGLPGRFWWAFGLFTLASITDWLDGYIARRDGLITNFGKFMDPLADKVLVMSAMICFIPVYGLSPVVVIIVMAREFLVTSLRLIAAADGLVIAADGWGKAKTVVTMLWICSALALAAAEPTFLPSRTIYFVGALLTTLLTVISGVNYLYANRALLSHNK